MFGLLYGLYELYFRPIQYQLLLLGLDNAGKTTYLEQLRHIYINNQHIVNPSHIPPTVGLNLLTIQYDNKSLVVWDLGGSSSLRVLWSKYYNECHVILFIIDSTITSFNERYHEISYELNNIINHNSLYDCPIIILLNKIDIHNNITIDTLKDMLKLNDNIIRSRPIKFIEISALNDINIQKSIQLTVDIASNSNRTKRIQSVNM